MANNPQAQYSPRRRADKLIQFDSVRNLPTIVFTKQVGETTLKTFVAEVIGNTLDTLAYDLDMSNKTLNVVLTRSNTGGTQGHLRVTASRFDPVVKLDTMELMLNLGPMKSAKDDADLITTLMHETVHYVQFQSGVMKGEVVNNFRTWKYTWNVTRSSEIGRRAQGSRSFVSEKSITPVHSDDVRVINRTSSVKGDYNYARYMNQPEERQAWTAVRGLAQQLYPQAIEASRKSMRTSYKTRLPRGARVYQ